MLHWWHKVARGVLFEFQRPYVGRTITFYEIIKCQCSASVQHAPHSLLHTTQHHSLRCFATNACRPLLKQQTVDAATANAHASAQPAPGAAMCREQHSPARCLQSCHPALAKRTTSSSSAAASDARSHAGAPRSAKRAQCIRYGAICRISTGLHVCKLMSTGPNYSKQPSGSCAH